MALGDFGKIAISEIVFYIPVLCIALFIALKRGFNKQQGFIFIFMFSLGASIQLDPPGSG
jgi:hypothetical protein